MNSLYVFRTATLAGAPAGVGAPSASAALVRVGFAPRAASFLPGKVGLQTVAAALTAVARLLVAAERRRRVELVERVRPDDAGAQLIGDLEDARALFRPDAGGQPVRRVVGLLD